LRAGTHNIPAIAGFAKAVEITKANFRENKRIERLRDRLHNGLLKKLKDIKLNGHPEKKLPNTLNIVFEGLEGESLLVNFDLKGICASAGSACTSGSLTRSHVLKAMGVDDETAKSAVRFSLGIENDDAEIDYCLKEIPEIVNRLRLLSLSPS
jgi:cysteine desulfurase